MATFSETVTSTAVLDAPRHEVWRRLSDPQALVRLTPLLRAIDADGDTWVWHLSKVGGLGLQVTPCFTEHMRFEPETLIEFKHRPPAGAKEWIAVEGRYDLSDDPHGVHLAISLTVKADLPLPRATGPAVRKIMKQTMGMMGDRFSANLLSELDAHQVDA